MDSYVAPIAAIPKLSIMPVYAMSTKLFWDGPVMQRFIVSTQEKIMMHASNCCIDHAKHQMHCCLNPALGFTVQSIKQLAG